MIESREYINPRDCIAIKFTDISEKNFSEIETRYSHSLSCEYIINSIDTIFSTSSISRAKVTQKKYPVFKWDIDNPGVLSLLPALTLSMLISKPIVQP